MSIVHRWMIRCLVLLAFAAFSSGCSEIRKARGTVRKVGPADLRTQTLAVCREGFAAEVLTPIDPSRWPDPVRAFQPAGLWAEPDGAYLLIESDAAGERGIYLPRILSEKDPLCSPTLTHEKLAEGVYWYERKRS